MVLDYYPIPTTLLSLIFEELVYIIFSAILNISLDELIIYMEALSEIIIKLKLMLL